MTGILFSPVALPSSWILVNGLADPPLIGYPALGDVAVGADGGAPPPPPRSGLAMRPKFREDAFALFCARSDH